MTNFEDYKKSLAKMTSKQLKAVTRSADPMWAIAATVVLQERAAKRAAK